MREYKFRGKRKDNSEWVYGCLLTIKEETYIAATKEKSKGYHKNLVTYDGHTFGIYKVIPETVGQYTGLKDKNGKEIYEGDILLYQGVDDLKPFYYEVQQRCGNWMACNELYFDLKDTDFIRIEIIGNIHENNIDKL